MDKEYQIVIPTLSRAKSCTLSYPNWNGGCVHGARLSVSKGLGMAGLALGLVLWLRFLLRLLFLLLLLLLLDVALL